jgi:ribosome biogenesis GTPase
MNTLNQYGWNSSVDEYYHLLKTSLIPGRVISIRGYKYHLITDKGELETELSGKLLFESEIENLPKVGDWVLFIDYDTTGYIVDLLPRTNALSRKNPGRRTEKQVLAANIDFAIIVQGLDRDFNLMRLDRYLAQVMSCGIQPVVVLNKADLVEDAAVALEEVGKLQRDCPVFICSTRTGKGISEIRDQIFLEGRTHILIGSSGVGKSSLLNALTIHETQKIGGVSDANSKGRHTTTSRDLFMLPNGAMIIDTPGMREFGVTFEDSSTDDEVFPVIRELSSKCRFSDCRHINEAGCAVIEALESGSLESVVYDSYIKLIKEQRRFQISADEKKQQNKMFGRMTKEAKDHRKKYKY